MEVSYTVQVTVLAFLTSYLRFPSTSQSVQDTTQGEQHSGGTR